MAGRLFSPHLPKHFGHSSSSFALTQPREHSSFDNLWGLSMLRILGEAGTSDHNTKRPRRHSLLFFGPCDDPPRRPSKDSRDLPSHGRSHGHFTQTEQSHKDRNDSNKSRRQPAPVAHTASSKGQFPPCPTLSS